MTVDLRDVIDNVAEGRFSARGTTSAEAMPYYAFTRNILISWSSFLPTNAPFINHVFLLLSMYTYC
jgi:hypothetical protein